MRNKGEGNKRGSKGNEENKHSHTHTNVYAMYTWRILPVYRKAF